MKAPNNRLGYVIVYLINKISKKENLVVIRYLIL
jgi:hypothetical protein